MPNSNRRPTSHVDPNEQLIFQYLQQELFDEDELPKGERPEERPPKYPLGDLLSVPPALESRPNLEVLKSSFEKHQENQIVTMNTEQKKVNNFESGISIFDEIPPLLPLRRDSYSHPCPGYQRVSVNSGQCKPPQLNGQGYDVPFPYPKHVSQSREQRAGYILSVVDKLVLELEYYMKQTKISQSLVHIENSVKSATGAVPKTNPRRLQSSVDVKRSSRQEKLGNLSLHRHHLPKRQHKKKQQQQIIEPEFDLDYEFCMDHIQKFRDNNIRPSALPAATLETDEGISSDSTASLKLYEGLVNEKPPKRLETVEGRSDATRPCTPVEPTSLSIKSNDKHIKYNQSMHHPVKSYKLEYHQQILVTEKKSKQQHITYPLQGQPKLTHEQQSKKQDDQKNLQKDQPNLGQEEKTLKKQEKDQKPKEKLQLEFYDRQREYQTRLIQERQAIFMETDHEELMLERLHKEDKKLRKQYKLQLGLEQQQQQKLNFIGSSEVLNYFKIGVDPYGRTLSVPSMPLIEQGQPQNKMGEGDTKTHFPLALEKPSVNSLSTSKDVQMAQVKFDDQDKQKSGLQLQNRNRNTSFVNRCDMTKNAGSVTKVKLSQSRLHPYDPCPAPKLVATVPEPEVTLAKEKEIPCPRKVDSKEVAQEEKNEKDFSEIMSKFKHLYVDPTKLPKLPDLSKASMKPNAAVVVYMPYKENPFQIFGRNAKGKLKKKVAKLRKKIWKSSDDIQSEKGHKKDQYRSFTQINELPPSGDFRSYFEIDDMSIIILERMAKLRYKKGFRLYPVVTEYLMHFYRQRCVKDTASFHWYVNEGFFPAHLLLEKHNPLGLHFEKASIKDIDIIVQIYLKQQNVDRKSPPMKLTKIMAYYMVTSYCRVLLEKATDTERPLEERFLLRTRFAVSTIESFMLDLNLNVLLGVVDCRKMLQWALLQEDRVREIYGEALRNAEGRAELGKHTKYVMRTTNLEAFNDFFNNNQYPRPDALAINPLMNEVRRYQLSDTERINPYTCPIEGCGVDICSKTLLAHFLSDHCRRLEELWLKDRMVYVFHPQSYPPDQIHCICCTALLPRKPTSSVPYPERVHNYELAPHHLYFAEHTPCLIMYTQISIDRLLPPSEPKTESESLKFFRPQQTLYVFWLGSSGDSERDFTCNLNIYGRDKKVPSHSPMKAIKMSKIHNIPHMMAKYEGRYLAIDYDSMSAMTNNFRELIYIDVLYVDLLSPKEGILLEPFGLDILNTEL